MSVSCERVLLGSLFFGPIASPQESNWLWYVVCDLETSAMRWPWPALGCVFKEEEERLKWKLSCALYMRYCRNCFAHKLITSPRKFYWSKQKSVVKCPHTQLKTGAIGEGVPCEIRLVQNNSSRMNHYKGDHNTIHKTTYDTVNLQTVELFGFVRATQTLKYLPF